jgi:hypothetical protein
MSRSTPISILLAVLAAGLGAGFRADARSAAATIEVIGGPHAGKYTLATTDNGCLISERAKGKKPFTAHIGIPPTDPRSKDPKALTSIMLDIFNVTATAPPPSDYLVQMTFGPVMDTRLGTFYMSGSNNTTGRKGGPGTVMLKNSGGTDATVSFDLQPESGIVVKGTITCSNPLRY